MYKKIAATLLVTSALMAPSFATAEETATAKEMALEETFVSRGLCESTLKRVRNVARQTVKANGGSGQTNSTINRLANPVIKFACTAVSGKGNGGSTLFKIVEVS